MSREFRKGFSLGTLFGCVGGLVTGGLLVWYFTDYARAYPAIEETRVASSLLRDRDRQLTPQLREYLKLRVYSNAAMWLPRNRNPGFQVDFGPVDEKVLGAANLVKDGTEVSMLYAVAMEAHRGSSGIGK